MNPISKAEVKELLSPYINRLNKVITGRINYYYNSPAYAVVRHEHSARSDASICHDLITKGLEAEFEGTTSVRFKKKKGLFMMIIKELVVLRFKKFNTKLLSSGIRTRQAMFFNLQDAAQLELGEMPPHGLLYIGYIPNELETGVGEIHVTYRYGNANVWTWELTAMDNTENILPFTIETKEPTRRKPKLKGTDNKNVGDNNAAGDI